MVELKQLQRPEKKSAAISIRTYPSYVKWIKDHDISPSILFTKAIEELINKNKKEE